MTNSAIAIRGILLLCCLAATKRVDAACGPDFPTPSTMLAGQGAAMKELQVIVPSYNFTCSGYITSVSIQAASEAGDDGFVFQVWRLQQAGMYHLKHSVDTSGATQRDGEMLIFNGTSIPVLAGDTIGYRLIPVVERVHLILDNSDASQEIVYYSKELTIVPCNFSTCDPEQDIMSVDFAPLISVVFEQADVVDDDGEQEVLCTPMEVTECNVPNIPPPLSATPTAPISSSITSVPLPTPVTSITAPVSPPSQTVDSPPSNPPSATQSTDRTGLIIGIVFIIIFAIVLAVGGIIIVLIIRKRRITTKPLGVVSYQETANNTHDSEIKTDTNEAYHSVNNNVITTTNPAYITTTTVTVPDQTEASALDNETSTYYEGTGISISQNPSYTATNVSESDAVDTSPNVAYKGTDITTSDNPAYVPTQDSI